MKRLPVLGVVLAVILFCVHRTLAGEEKPKELILKVVNGESGKVIEGVKLDYTLDERNFEKAGLDEKGEFRLALKEAKQVRFELGKEGFVNDSVRFGGEDGIKPIPAEYTMKMWPGGLVGGVVRDEEGKAVADVKVGVRADY